MTAPAFVSAASVREYLSLDPTASASKYSDETIGSNIRAASWTLERATGRVFGDITATKLFTTNGAAYLTIPGLRTATAVSLQGTALTADLTYWLTPDVQQSGVFTGVQFRPFGSYSTRSGPAYLSNPEWFDRGLDFGLDSYRAGYGGFQLTSLPNDLSIAGSWGYTDMPEPIRHATKVLAAYYTLRPQAILSGSLVTPDGNFVNLSNLPVEVREFVAEWDVRAQVASA